MGHARTVGAIGLLTGERRSATVYAVRDTLLAKLSQGGFDRLLHKHPQAMMRQFAARISKELRAQQPGLSPPTKPLATLAMVPLSPAVPMAEFARHLARAFAALGKAWGGPPTPCATGGTTAAILARWMKTAISGM